jgi:hypothetical protein
VVNLVIGAPAVPETEKPFNLRASIHQDAQILPNLQNHIIRDDLNQAVGRLVA